MERPTTEQVAGALRRATQEPVPLDYMTDNLAQAIDGATIEASSHHMLSLIAGGVDPMCAGQIVAQQVLVFAFNLGLAAGREMQASDSFAAMMGGAFGGPSTDAGDGE